jgi:hypothetical protein
MIGLGCIDIDIDIDARIYPRIRLASDGATTYVSARRSDEKANIRRDVHSVRCALGQMRRLTSEGDARCARMRDSDACVTQMHRYIPAS